jgi:hypothetical protein
VFGFFVGENMDKSKTQAEYDWLKKQTGVTSKYINEMWEQYFVAQEVGDEVEWLKTLIAAESETPKNTKYASELWVQLLTILSLNVSTSYNENRDTYFRNT